MTTLLFLAMFFQTTHHRPMPLPPQSWNPAMCPVTAPAQPLSAGVIIYCEKSATSPKPTCPASSTVPVKLDGPWKLTGTYFEPWDCTWHFAPDPRTKQ
jgi:hypothetical protein